MQFYCHPSIPKLHFFFGVDEKNYFLLFIFFAGDSQVFELGELGLAFSHSRFFMPIKSV